jgi:protein TonB
MKNHFAGMTLSLFLHLGVLSIFLAGANKLSLATKNQPIPLQLSVFVPSPPPSVLPKVEPQSEPVTKIPPKPKKIKPKVKRLNKPKFKVKQSPKSKPTKRPKPKIKPTPKTITEPEQEPKKPPTKAAPPPQPQTDAVGIRNAEKLYKNALSRAFEQNKHYPRRARRMRKQGLVNVSFTIEQSGKINNIRIEKSSGSAILDEAAIRTVKRIDGQLPFPKEIKRSHWDMTVPINFELN